MKKILLSVLIIGLIALPLSAEAFSFSDLFNFSKNTSTVQANQTVSISELNNKLSSVDASMQNALINIVSILSDESEVSSIKTKLASIKSNLKANEAQKSTLISNLLSSYAAELKANKQEVIQNVKNMAISEKAELINNVISMAKDGKEYLSLAKNYADAANKISKAATTANEVATNVSQLKQAALSLSNNAKTVAKTTSTIAGILQSGGIKFNLQ